MLQDFPFSERPKPERSRSEALISLDTNVEAVLHRGRGMFVPEMRPDDFPGRKNPYVYPNPGSHPRLQGVTFASDAFPDSSTIQRVEMVLFRSGLTPNQKKVIENMTGKTVYGGIVDYRPNPDDTSESFPYSQYVLLVKNGQRDIIATGTAFEEALLNDFGEIPEDHELLRQRYGHKVQFNVPTDAIDRVDRKLHDLIKGYPTRRNKYYEHKAAKEETRQARTIKGRLGKLGNALSGIFKP